MDKLQIWVIGMAERFCTKSFVRLENNFLNTSYIVNGSNVKPFFAPRKKLVERDLLSGRPNCFHAFQSFFGCLVFPFSFSSRYAFSFFELNFGLFCASL